MFPATKVHHRRHGMPASPRPQGRNQHQQSPNGQVCISSSTCEVPNYPFLTYLEQLLPLFLHKKNSTMATA